jgi:Fe-S cluster biosynthesis and repair protein YggX
MLFRKVVIVYSDKYSKQVNKIHERNRRFLYQKEVVDLYKTTDVHLNGYMKS